MHFEERTVSLELLAQPLDLLGDLGFAAEMHPRPHQAGEFQHAPALAHAEIVEIDLLSGRERDGFRLDDVLEPANRG